MPQQRRAGSAQTPPPLPRPILALPALPVKPVSLERGTRRGLLHWPRGRRGARRARAPGDRRAARRRRGHAGRARSCARALVPSPDEAEVRAPPGADRRGDRAARRRRRARAARRRRRARAGRARGPAAARSRPARCATWPATVTVAVAARLGARGRGGRVAPLLDERRGGDRPRPARARRGDRPLRRGGRLRPARQRLADAAAACAPSCAAAVTALPRSYAALARSAGCATTSRRSS